MSKFGEQFLQSGSREVYIEKCSIGAQWALGLNVICYEECVIKLIIFYFFMLNLLLKIITYY